VIDPDELSRFRLSSRGERLLSVPPAPEYITEHFARAGDPWHPTSNRGGYIGVCVAENRLVWDLLEPMVTAPREVPPGALAYDRFTGSALFRERLASFLGERVLGRPILPEQIAVLAGAGSVLELLFYAIGDPGDGVLVPTPSYAGFWLDLETRNALTIVPVHCSSRDGFRLTTGRLESALAEAGRPVKALLYTNPDNPRGAVASPEEVEQVLEWTEAHGMHLVCDEIYALSVFGDRRFTSCADLRPQLGEQLHIVWAFSKDFAASGLRCGVLVTENEALLRAVEALAYWECCSGDTQHLLGEMISDRRWTDLYIYEMRRRLGAAYRAAAAALERAGIPYLPAEAGFFLLLDLRSALSEPSWAAEQALWRRLLDEANVNVTPGAACRIAEPGFMRFCFAAVASEAAVEAVRRIGRVVRGETAPPERSTRRRKSTRVFRDR
jgi:aspartate/methionine/tyrosine aminotransferase